MALKTTDGYLPCFSKGSSPSVMSTVQGRPAVPVAVLPARTCLQGPPKGDRGGECGWEASPRW